jgi:hypothetical protein
MNMTTITLTRNELVKVNNRYVFDTTDIAEISKVSGGVWEGKTYFGDTFRIVGGKSSGGASNEWFLEYAMAFGNQIIKCTSAIECFKTMGRV